AGGFSEASEILGYPTSLPISRLLDARTRPCTSHWVPKYFVPACGLSPLTANSCPSTGLRRAILSFILSPSRKMHEGVSIRAGLVRRMFESRRSRPSKGGSTCEPTELRDSQ